MRRRSTNSMDSEALAKALRGNFFARVPDPLRGPFSDTGLLFREGEGRENGDPGDGSRLGFPAIPPRRGGSARCEPPRVLFLLGRSSGASTRQNKCAIGFTVGGGPRASVIYGPPGGDCDSRRFFASGRDYLANLQGPGNAGICLDPNFCDVATTAFKIAAPEIASRLDPPPSEGKAGIHVRRTAERRPTAC